MEHPTGEYLSMEYGPYQGLPCNVHRSSGTQGAGRLHYHDFYQIYFVLRGSFAHGTEKASVRLYRGECFIIPPFFSHRIARNSENALFYSFSFREDFLPERIMENGLVEELFAALTPERLMPRIQLGPEELRRMEELMRFSQREFEEKRPGWDFALRGLLSAILVLLSRAYAPGRREGGGCAPFSECLAYLETHFTEGIPLAAAAERAYMSPAAFSRAFRAAEGASYGQYTASRRIDYACGLLAETDKPAEAVSAESGYGDYSAFYRAFRRETGTTPRAYRKRQKASGAQAAEAARRSGDRKSQAK